MRGHFKNATVLWTGGKDSVMALHEAEQSGYHVRCLVTFIPPKPSFFAHPLAFIKLQAQALGLPHYVLVVDSPYEKNYEDGLRWLREEMRVNTVVTGDIEEVDKHPNWIRERSLTVGMEVYTPLWHRARQALLQQLLTNGYKARISCVKRPLLAESWVGRRMERPTITELVKLCARNGMDLCGERGEYHTLVTDGPRFAYEVSIGSYSRRSAGALTYMELRDLALAGGTIA